MLETKWKRHATYVGDSGSMLQTQAVSGVMGTPRNTEGYSQGALPLVGGANESILEARTKLHFKRFCFGVCFLWESGQPEVTDTVQSRFFVSTPLKLV